MTKKIDVVLVTYNRLSLLKECLEALLQQEGISKIFIINNNSNDGTEEYLSMLETDPKVNAESLKENIGGAAGFEYGVKKATQQGFGDYVWIMDDDTIPNKNAAINLLRAADLLKDKFGFLCSNVRWIDNTPSNIAHVNTNWPSKINEGLIQVDAATFVSILVPKDNIKIKGYPIGKMQIWGDDTEYTTRLSSYKESYFVADSVVIHKTAYNLVKDSLKNIEANRISRFEAMFRNLIYIKRKFGSKKDVLKMIVGNLLKGFGALSAKNHRLKRLKAAVVGTVKGLFFNPEIKK